MRLHQRPTDEQLAQISTDFADIKVKGEFRLSGPLPVERDEPSLDSLHRLVFVFNRRDHGRLRMLINRLNDLAV
jgi:hypothetical protein